MTDIETRLSNLERRVTKLEGVDPLWAQWANGPTADPIVVPWANRADFPALKAIGVTHVLYPKNDIISVPTQLLIDAGLAGLKVVMGYRGSAHELFADVIDGWFVEPDEPDGWNPTTKATKVMPALINEQVRRIRAADRTRPIWLSLNMGVAVWPTPYEGRGTRSKILLDYNGSDGYLAEADVVTFNVYPGSYVGNSLAYIKQNWELAEAGILNLRLWAYDAGRDPYKMAFGHWCEAAPVRGLPPLGREPLPSEIAEQVRLSRAAGARMIAFFPIRAMPAPNDLRYGITHEPYKTAMRDIISGLKAAT